MPRNVDATEQPVAGAPVEVVIHPGDRAALMPLFRLADDSERAIAGYFARGTLLVAKHATATADTGLLRFYQRLGFRMTRIERDAFTSDAGYPPDLIADGIPILDRVWLDRAC